MIVEPDEVKTKEQLSTGRKEIWTSTAVVLVAGLRYEMADSSMDGLWLQVWALLFELEVLGGGRRLLVLGDGASWIRTWFESLGIDPKAMIVCWWHLRKRCSECLSLAGGPKDRRRALEKALLDRLWEAKVDEAMARLREAAEWVRNPKALEDLLIYLKLAIESHHRIRSSRSEEGYHVNHRDRRLATAEPNRERGRPRQAVFVGGATGCASSAFRTARATPERRTSSSCRCWPTCSLPVA